MMSQLEMAMLKGIVAAHERWDERFEHAKWEALVDPLRPLLRKVREAGGDGDYVLFVLSCVRWRFGIWARQEDLDECQELLETIERVAKRKGIVGRRFEKSLEKLAWGLREVLVWNAFYRDQSAFDEKLVGGDGLGSRLIYRALAALDDHFRKTIAPRSLNHEELLAEIVNASGMRSWDESDRKGRQAASEEPAESFSTVEWVHKRLQRAPKQLLKPVHGWIVAHLPEDMVVAYHEFHHGAGFDCGRACQAIEYLWLRKEA
jgi:hypothetical protein